jgi:hypothetical protein
MKLLIAILLVFVIADVLIICYVMVRRIQKRFPKKFLNEIRSNWKQLIRQQDHRNAIMDADKLLDHVLSKLGMKGNLGSKLKRVPHLFSDIDSVWKAHKVRNNIAHQIHYKVNEKTYKKTMLAFKRAFQDLNIF